MPWTKLILSDMAVLQDRVLARSQFFLPPPAEAPETWGKFIRGCGASWSPLVQQLFYAESVADGPYSA
eukprot:9395332-Pyramimonas_sp.AAC.1